MSQGNHCLLCKQYEGSCRCSVPIWSDPFETRGKAVEAKEDPDKIVARDIMTGEGLTQKDIDERGFYKVNRAKRRQIEAQRRRMEK